ncbi:MAG: porin family protein [Solitalea-like symbiont of Tyrophagus putrescentiae]
MPAFLNSAGNIDDSPINFGFLLEVNRPNLHVNKLANFTEINFPDQSSPGVNNTLLAIENIPKISFAAGFLASLSLTNNLDIRITPRFTFLGRGLRYRYYKGEAKDNVLAIIKDIPSTLVELPLLLKYKGNRDANFRPYVIGGLSYNIDIRKNKKYNDSEFPLDSDDRFVKLKNNYIAWEVGLGIEIYNVYFKLTPEIRFSKSIGSILFNRDENKFTRPLIDLNDQLIRLTFYFE